MHNLLLAKVPFIMNVLAVLWVLIAICLILIILVQKGKGGGLGAAFGGGAGSLMGTKTGDFFTWVTIILVALFLFFGLIMVKYYKPQAGKGLEADMPQQQQQPQMSPEVQADLDAAMQEAQDAEQKSTTDTQKNDSQTMEPLESLPEQDKQKNQQQNDTQQ